MKDNTERDTKKVIDKLSTTSSTISSHTFNTIDKTAKIFSNYKESKQLERQEKKDSESRLKTTENDAEKVEVSQKETENSASVCKLKTHVEESETSDSKTINNTIDGSNSEKIKNDVNLKKSRMKTTISKASKKIFGFNDNQGKVSKLVTIIGRSGDRISKTGKTIVRTSRELDKAINENGTGTEYLNAKIGRKIKTKAKKVVKKKANKIKNKIQKTIGKKLAQITKTIVTKLLKMLISLLTATAEFIIPAALVILIIIFIGSIFGSSASEDTINSYKQYMISIQEEYDKKVDDFVKENPEGIVIGVNGSYGKIDWRIPLSILQGTNAELKLDQDEKDLIQKFKEANLLEKHEIVEQTVIDNHSGNTMENTVKVLVITNAMYEDYAEWCKNNYQYISDFNKKKGISDGTDIYFCSDQLDIIKMLYESDSFSELLGDDFKTKTPIFGSTGNKANLNSEYYNSKNILATSGFKGQCTWYSHGRALELFNRILPSGNAQTWLNSAVTMGYETGTQPSYNSVAVLMGRKFGHVAFVEAYDGTSITISEGNIGNPCSDDDSCSAVEYANEHANELVRTKTYSSFDEYRKASKRSGLTIVGFIYLK